ncbi:hypothetical protein B0H14DRAFT_2555886 [Mycena olivaceomarginata]|nr:hypothetical protein B0H14DRAFT_2555886 [Mycena olivaceomarginata]
MWSCNAGNGRLRCEKWQEATEGREMISLPARKRKMAEATPKTASEAQIKASQPFKTLDKLLMEYESNSGWSHTGNGQASDREKSVDCNNTSRVMSPNEQPSCSELRDRNQTGPIASEPPQECERGQKKRNGEEEQEKRGKQNKEKKAERKKRRVKNYLQRPEPGKHNCVQIQAQIE